MTKEEQQNLLKCLPAVAVDTAKLPDRCKYGDEKSVALRCAGSASSNAANEKRLCDSFKQSFPELKSTVRSHKRVMMMAGSEGKEVFEDGSSFSANGLLALPSDGSPQMLDSFNPCCREFR